MPRFPRYRTPEEFDKAVNDYEATCKLNKKALTFTGMALHLGFASKISIDYYKKFPEFVDSVDRAKLLIENQYEENLSTKGIAPVGSIFALKQFGWSDKHEIKHSHEDEFMDLLLDIVKRNKNASEDNSTKD